MTTILFIRHGAYDEGDRQPAHVGQGLTARGLRQAQATATWISGLDLPISAIQSSDFTRAHQTALAIAAALPGVALETHTYLRECPSIHHADTTSVPSSAQEAFDALFTNGGTDHAFRVVVCHANLMRYLFARLFGWSRLEWENTFFAHCSVSRVELQAVPVSNASLVWLADVAHLPPELR